jgi:16S rRNA (guanine966-N2)-methyltransferase
VADDLRKLLAEWGAPHATVVAADARQFLAGDPQPFDIVFLDPPFASRDLLATCAGLLEERGWLGPRALIYVECAAREGLPRLPASWRASREGRAGEVGYHLLEHET